MLEAIDTSVFLVDIPGSPLSFGRLCFVLAGFICINNIKMLTNNGIFNAFIWILLGLFFGAFVSIEVYPNLTKTIGLALLVISASSISIYWDESSFKRLLNYMMTFMFFYWLTYFILNLFYENVILSYSVLFNEGLAVNHHVIGIKISISGLYLASKHIGYSYYKDIISYIFLFLSITVCFFVESRSNTIFTIFGASLIYFNYKKISLPFLFFTIPTLFFIVLYYLESIFEFEQINRRFDVTDFDYQQRSNASRIKLYSLFFDSFLENPIGRGISDIRLQFDSINTYFVHNQYLSFIIAGGIVSMIGVIKWLVNIGKIIKLFYSEKIKFLIKRSDFMLAVPVFIFNVTLLTIDFSGMFFFLMTSFSIFLVTRYNLIESNLNKKL